MRLELRPHVVGHGARLQNTERHRDHDVLHDGAESAAGRIAHLVNERGAGAPQFAARRFDAEPITIAQRNLEVRFQAHGGKADLPRLDEPCVAAFDVGKEILHRFVRVIHEARKKDDAGGVDFVEADGAFVRDHSLERSIETGTQLLQMGASTGFVPTRLVLLVRPRPLALVG